MAQKDPSKTEKATPKRINKAREDGNVAKSQELTKLVSILAGLFVLSAWIPYMSHEILIVYRYFMTESMTFDLNEANLGAMFSWLFFVLAKLLLPVVLVVALATAVSLRLQVGKLWAPKVFKFKFKAFNLIAGLKRMFMSTQALIRLLKSLVQAIVIGFAPYLVIKGQMDVFLTLYDRDAAGVAIYILEMGYKIVMYALVPMIGIAAFDFWYTRHEYQENLKMTKDEIKDERKQAEGDPLIKSKMRQKMMAVAMKRMMQNVPKADVVITNPTHIAVALMYKPDEFPAPVIVAMGADKVAEKIKEIAREHNVPVKENKPLARALYKQVEVGDMIPAELFQAVASILAQIWQTRPRKQ